MKRFLLVVALALAAASTTASAQYWARTWDWVDGYTSPGAVKEGQAWVGVWGQWPTDELWVPDLAAVTVSGNLIFLDAYDSRAAQIALPGPANFDLGDYVTLAPGYYNLYVSQYSNFWPLPALEFEFVRGAEYLTTFPVYFDSDANLDGTVDVVDLLWLVDAFGSAAGEPNYNLACDINGDDSVDVVDLLYLVEDFGGTID